MQDKTNPFAFYAGLHLLFAFYANIVKGECRDKRELYFRFDYAEPDSVFVFTNIVKGECKGKRKSHFRFDYVEPPPIFYKYKDLFLYGEIFSLVRTERRAVSRGMKGKGERKRQAEEPEFFRLSLCDSSQCYSLTFARFTLPAVWTSTT